MNNLVIIVTSEFGKRGGGLSKSCYEFVILLKSIGFHVKIVISASEVDDDIKNDEEFDFIEDNTLVLKGGYKPELHKHLFFRSHIENTVQLLSQNKPKIIIAFGGGENALFACELKSRLSSKLIIMLRGSEMNLSISDNQLFYSNYQSLKESEAVIALSVELLDRAKQIYYNANVIYAIIPNIIEFKNQNQSEIRNDNIIFGIGAKYINEKKGVGNLIQVTHHLNAIGRENFYLRVAGKIDEDLKSEYIQYAKKLNIEDKITFLNDLNCNEFTQEIQNWDFAVQSSFCEGFSNTIGEAIALGKLFFTTNTGYIAENIKSYANELIFDDFCPQKMARQIYLAYFTPDILSKTTIVKQHLQKLTTSDMVKLEWIKLFDKLNQIQPCRLIPNQHILSIILHDISDKNYTNVDIPKDELIKLCNLVSSKGFRFVSAREYFHSNIKDNLIICTFDDAYCNVYELAFPIFKRHRFTATIFVCSDYIGISNSWNKKDKTNRQHLTIDSLRDLENHDWEIGSHGTNHLSFLRLDTEQIHNTLIESKSILEKYFKRVYSFAYPYGDYNFHISKMTREVYENIFAVNEGGTHIVADRHKIRRYTTDELTLILSR